MIIRSIKSLGVLSAMAVCLNIFAQEPNTAIKIIGTGIAGQINGSGHHSVEAPDEILKLLLPGEEDAEEETTVRKGPAMRTVYRVQVFSDSKGERSRAEGEKKRRAVQSRFPEYQCSLGWHTPYWKVKVGIFSTQSEAAAAAEKIKRAFPAYAREVHVIRDRMKISVD